MGKRINFNDIVIFQNDNYIVVDKPSGLSTLTDRAGGADLLAMAREQYEDAQVCHRLDKETSGCLVFAKTPDAYRHLSMQFEERQVKKVYHALVDGIVDFTDKVVTAPIKVHKQGVVSIDREGKDSVTYFNVLHRFKKHTLLACMPTTGRMHQIRIHLAHIGYPIVADHLYGGQDFFLSSYKRKFNLGKFEDEQPLIRRVALHAYAIQFKDLNNEDITAETTYPKDFSIVLKQMEKNS